MAPLELFSRDDVTKCVKREITLACQRYRFSDEPKAILLAGQPGAGKTQLSTMFSRYLKGNAAFINADDYRRYHPNYHELYAKFGSDSVQLTSLFSSDVANKLIDRLSDKHFNLIIEGTGRTVNVPQHTAEKLNVKGYTAELAVIAARPEVSLISTLLRFYQMNVGGTIPRATAVEAHDHIVDVLPNNLDLLLDVPEIARITIWDRNMKMLFNSENDCILPSEVLLNYWDSPWTNTEIQNAEEQIERLYLLEDSSGLGQLDIIKEISNRVPQIAFTENQDSSFELQM